MCGSAIGAVGIAAYPCQLSAAENQRLAAGHRRNQLAASAAAAWRPSMHRAASSAAQPVASAAHQSCGGGINRMKSGGSVAYRRSQRSWLMADMWQCNAIGEAADISRISAAALFGNGWRWLAAGGGIGGVAAWRLAWRGSANGCHLRSAAACGEKSAWRHGRRHHVSNRGLQHIGGGWRRRRLWNRNQ
jgi:hypothetical protein